MIQCVRNGELSAHELPDAIVTLDNGIIFHTTFASCSQFRNAIKRVNINHPEEMYVFLQPEKLLLPFFINMLYCFDPPEPHIAPPFLPKYIDISQVKFTPIDPRKY